MEVQKTKQKYHIPQKYSYNLNEYTTYITFCYIYEFTFIITETTI